MMMMMIIVMMMWRGASEEEDPADPLSDAIFHPKPGGLILQRHSFLGNKNTFVNFLLNFFILVQTKLLKIAGGFIPPRQA